MRGTLTIVYPDKPMDVRIMSSVPEFEELQRLVGGLVTIIPGWDHCVTFSGAARPCTVLANEEGLLLKLPFNFWATAAYQLVLRAKGAKGQLQPLVGTVVIAEGDDDFMALLL